MNALSDASSITALTRSSNRIGRTMTLRGTASKRPERIGVALDGQVGDQHAPLFSGALTDEPFADAQVMTVTAFARVGERRKQNHLGAVFRLHLINDALLRINERRQLREQHAADGAEIALTLQHAREASEVGLEPVLLFVAVGREPQVVDHRVDVVFELRDFAAGFHLNRTRKSPLVTAVVTSAMARTWLVKLSASRLTLPVRSFHVPAAPGTLA